VAPTGDGVAVTTIVLFTLDTTARSVALPSAFWGQFIRVMPIGANVRWFLSNNKAAAVDVTVAVPTAAGATNAKLGSYIANGTERERICPSPATVSGGAVVGSATIDGNIYLCWQGDAVGTFLQVEKGSGRPYQTTRDG
jgi:hypothetical protein